MQLQELKDLQRAIGVASASRAGDEAVEAAAQTLTLRFQRPTPTHVRPLVNALNLTPPPPQDVAGVPGSPWSHNRAATRPCHTQRLFLS